MADAVSGAAESAAAGSATALPGLCGRRPVVAPERLVAELVPPPRFAAARFETYLPDPGEPSQAAARELLAGWAAGASDSAGARAGRGGLFRRGRGGGR